MEMTDMEQDQVGASAEPQENPKDTTVGKGQNGEEEYTEIFHVDGFEDFEEFVLDFDDYDLLESIHSHLNSPVEPIRHRFEDNPGVRRHLVKKSSRCQVTRANNGSPSLSSLKKRKKLDKKTHEARL